MEEQYQQAIRYWTLAQPVVSAYVAAVVLDFRDRDDVLQAIVETQSDKDIEESKAI
jgi:RNA polymerase sigma-70 factor (ECF subfamily)